MTAQTLERTSNLNRSSFDELAEYMQKFRMPEEEHAKLGTNMVVDRLDDEFGNMKEAFGVQQDNINVLDTSVGKSGTFKENGAFNSMRFAPEGMDIKCNSAGSHTLGCIAAAKVLGKRLHAFFPESIPPGKLALVRQMADPSTVTLHPGGKSLEESATRCEEHPDAYNVHPFNHPATIMGQAVMARTILKEVPDVERVVTNLGGGGNAAGLRLGFHEVGRDDIEIVGAMGEGSDAYLRSKQEGRLTKATRPNPRYAGLRVSEGGEWNHAILSRAPNIKMITVPDPLVRDVTDYYVQQHVDLYGPRLHGVRLYEATSMVAFSALALDELKDDKKTVVVGTGRNDNPSSILNFAEPFDAQKLTWQYPGVEFEL